MTPARLTLSEHAESEQVFPLPVAEALCAASGGALSLGKPAGGGVRLRASHHVGVVAAAGWEVHIAPKVPAANVLAMLAEVTGLTSWRPEAGHLAVHEDLLRTTVAFFAKEVSELLAAGPQRAYEPRAEDLVGVRGRIDLGAMVRRGGMAMPLACRFEEYDLDHLLHRYLVAGIRRSLRVPGLDLATRRRLQHARMVLAEVEDRGLAADAIDRHVFTRLDRRYRPATALCRIILERTSLRLGPGGTQVPGFVVDMHQLFERWVAARLPAHLGPGLSLRTQTRRRLDAHGQLAAIRPDLEVMSHGRCVVVADTKYKLTDSGLGRIGDYYQALAYATVIGLPHALLIYCQDGGDQPPSVVRVTNSPVEIHALAVRLAGDAATLDAEVRQVAEHIERLNAAQSARVA